MGKLCLALALPAFLRVIGFVVEPLLSDAEIHRTLGEPAQIRRSVPDPAHLSVVTWNIERGKAYDAIVRELKALDADVVLLQEVDRGCRRTGYRDVARDLAHATSMIRDVVSGSERGAPRDMTLMAASAALFVADRVPSFEAGVRRSPDRRSSASSRSMASKCCASRHRRD